MLCNAHIIMHSMGGKTAAKGEDPHDFPIVEKLMSCLYING